MILLFCKGYYLTSPKKKCPTCSKPLEGPTKVFHEFMNKYTSQSYEEMIKTVKKKIYATRSKITHGGILLGDDLHPYWASISNLSQRHKMEGHILRCLVREAIVNWFNEWKWASLTPNSGEKGVSLDNGQG